MTKSEAIKAAYGQWYEECKPDENGWSTNVTMETLFFTGRSEVVLFPSKYVEKWRPESLSGIENNRGWTRIESEEDIPDNNELYNSGLLDNEGVFHHEEKRHAPKTLKWLFQRKFITHYRKVDSVPPPIF